MEAAALKLLSKFKKMADKGKVRQARTPEQDIADVMKGKMPATDISINPFDDAASIDYESGLLQKRLQDADLYVDDNMMGQVFAGQSKEAVEALKKALNDRNPYAIGKAYGYTDDDTAAFYRALRGGMDDIAAQEFMRDLEQARSQDLMKFFGAK